MNQQGKRNAAAVAESDAAGAAGAAEAAGSSGRYLREPLAAEVPEAKKRAANAVAASSSSSGLQQDEKRLRYVGGAYIDSRKTMTTRQLRALQEEIATTRRPQ